MALEVLSFNTLLKIFQNSSIVNLTTEALNLLFLLLNPYQSRRLYFRDCICRLWSQFKALRSGFRSFVIKYIIEDLSKFFNSELNNWSSKTIPSTTKLSSKSASVLSRLYLPTLMNLQAWKKNTLNDQNLHDEPTSLNEMLKIIKIFVMNLQASRKH